MKHNQGKIKSEHHILKDFKPFLKEIENIDKIKRIIPGRISRQQKGTGEYHVTFSYFTISGLKYNLKKGATVQELFVVCNEGDKTLVRQKIEKIIKA